MEIENLSENYVPDDNSVDILKKSKIVFLVGITSSGKDALQQRLVELGGYRPIVTHTTRSPRYNNGVMELEGVDYHFVTNNDMVDLLKSHKMIEINHFSGNYYGTSVQEFEDANNKNQIAVCNIDVNGVASFYKIIPQNITAVFVVPPDYNTWTQRASRRCGSVESFIEIWNKRRNFAISELEHALEQPYYHFVINDNLNEAVNSINEIVHHSRDDLDKNDNYARQRAKLFLEEIKNNL